MPITDAARILLVADASQADEENTKAKFRRYRLARQVDASRRDRPGPRYDASQADEENTKAKFRRHRLARQVDASRRDPLMSI